MKADKTDEQLLGEFQAGKNAALAELARRYEQALLGLTSGLLGGRRELACDAVQETWLRVIRFGNQFMGRSSFKIWLYRIAVNQCRTLQTTRSEPDVGDAVKDQADNDNPPERASHAADRNHTLQSAIARLEPDRRLVVLLCYHTGMTHAQAAEILEVPVGTLKSRLHAALNDLRASLATEAQP
ncbi:MAG: sigma-70 family RNA polymerase sigma factor [Planctomycetota bacterium]